MFLVFLFSCQKNYPLKITVIDSHLSYDIHSIETFNDSLYITGGDIWDHGFLGTSFDGIHWDIDSLTNKSIFDLHATDNLIYGVGVSGYVLSGPPFHNNRTKFWNILKSITTTVDNNLIAVGGKDWNKGWVLVFDNQTKIDTLLYFDHELQTVKTLPSGDILCAGYGILMISKDQGYSWEILRTRGDFFTSIENNNTDITFLLGSHGNLYTSNDGYSWKRKENLGNHNWKKIYFDCCGKGIIVGQDMIATSNDNGMSWVTYKVSDSGPLSDVISFRNQWYATGKAGKIIIIEK